MPKHPILISACLLGEKVRYDGGDMRVYNLIIKNWKKLSLLIPLCPEVSGGLPTPRKPAEIVSLNDDNTKVINIENINVTQKFIRGAKTALEVCKQNNIKLAILTESSPSCGSGLIHNGRFDGKKIPGEGITTRLLRKNNIQVFNQFQIEQALDFYQTLIEPNRKK